MRTAGRARAVGFGVVLLAGALTACGKPAAKGGGADAQAAKTGAAAAPAVAGDNGGAQRSESIATNVPDPTCPTCQRADASTGETASRPPLDPAFRDDVELTINLTTQVMSDGVAILEKHAKDPAAAKAELVAYREKNKKHLDELAFKTKDIAVRLKAIGYDAEMPEDVRPGYEEKMTKLLGRLEAVRGTYAKHADVLEAFGPFLRFGD